MNKLEHTSSLGIPEGYFEDLKMGIHREVEISEAEQFLDGYCQRKSGLQVEDTYFYHLSKDIKPLTHASKTPVVSLWKWASAAAACGVMAIMGIIAFDNSEPEVLADEKTFDQLLADTPVTEDYLVYLEYDDLEDLSFTEPVVSEVSENTIDYLLEDQELLDLLTEDYLEL